jgi:hypothetical protein
MASPREYWVARVARAVARGRAKAGVPYGIHEAVARARQVDRAIGSMLFEETESGS